MTNRVGRHSRSGSGGSVTSDQLHPGTAAIIPFAARIPVDDQECNTLWVNQHSQVRPRQVIGSKVLIRQQPPVPPKSPEILLLSDEVMCKFVAPDKYIKCIAMFGYSLRNYAQDIADKLIDVQYPYIIIHLGTMQLGVFQLQALQKDLQELMETVTQINDKSLVVFSGILPRPLDHHRSRNRCVSYNKALRNTVDQLRKDNGWNCTMVDGFQAFLQEDGKISDPSVNFHEDLYLSEAGIRIIRAEWLRYLDISLRK